MGGAGQDPILALEGLDGQCIGQVALANASGTTHQDVLVAWDEGTGSKILYERTVDTGCGQEIKQRQCFRLVAAGLSQSMPVGCKNLVRKDVEKRLN